MLDRLSCPLAVLFWPIECALDNSGWDAAGLYIALVALRGAASPLGAVLGCSCTSEVVLRTAFSSFS